MVRFHLLALGFVAIAAGCSSMPNPSTSQHSDLSKAVNNAYRQGVLLESTALPEIGDGAIVVKPQREDAALAFLQAYLKKKYFNQETADKLNAFYSNIKPGTIRAYLWHTAISEKKPGWLTKPPSKRDGITSIVVPAWHLYLFDDKSILTPDLGFYFGADVKKAAKNTGLDFDEIQQACTP